MYLVVDATQQRHFPTWLVRVNYHRQWYQVVNFMSPAFWCEWWFMWRGRRWHGLRWFLVHPVQAIPIPSHIPAFVASRLMVEP